MEWSDEELIARVKKGDRTAFDKLAERYKSKMFSLIYRMTGDRESALDLMQDTFFSAFTNMKTFRKEAKFSSWLYRIASNKTLNYLKRSKLVKFITLSANPSDEPVYELKDKTENAELSLAIAKAVGNLPDKQKLTFHLRYFDKLSFVEIAKILNKSESTVKTNYQKAIEKLQKALKDFR
jgi:RNA polymerase sigma-70 factor (ECF subfamily)